MSDSATTPETAVPAAATTDTPPAKELGVVVNPVIEGTTPAPATPSVQLPPGTEPQKSSAYISEADLKKVYRSCVDTALKGYVGERAHMDSFVEELVIELHDFLLIMNSGSQGNRVDVRHDMITMLTNIGGFALGSAACLAAQIRDEVDQRHQASKIGMGRTIGDAATEQANKILRLPGLVHPKAKQYLSLNSTVNINGTVYEVKRAPLTWDGEFFSGPHGPNGAPRFLTIQEAIFNDMIIPTGRVPDTQPLKHIFSTFRYKDTDYNIIKSGVHWCERSLSVEVTEPDTPTLTHRYGVEHAVGKGYVERSPIQKMFVSQGAVYGIIQDNVEWDGQMVVVKRGMAEIRYSIAGAVSGGFIKWIKEITQTNI
jgi:hypothetical protein